MNPKLYFQILKLLDTEKFLINSIQPILHETPPSKVIIYLFEDKSSATKNLFKPYNLQERFMLFQEYLDYTISKITLKHKNNPFIQYQEILKKNYTNTLNLLLNVNNKLSLHKNNIKQILLPQFINI